MSAVVRCLQRLFSLKELKHHLIETYGFFFVNGHAAVFEYSQR